MYELIFVKVFRITKIVIFVSKIVVSTPIINEILILPRKQTLMKEFIKKVYLRIMSRSLRAKICICNGSDNSKPAALQFNFGVTKIVDKFSSNYKCNFLVTNYACCGAKFKFQIVELYCYQLSVWICCNTKIISYDNKTIF